MRATLALTLFCLTAVPHAALAEQPPPPEELRLLMARRFTAHTGVPLSIEALQYNVFTSTISGSGVVAGPAKQPLFKVARVELRLALRGGEGKRGLSLLKAEGVLGKLPRRRLLGRIVLRPGRSLFVERAEIKISSLVFPGPEGVAVVLEGATLTAQGLRLPASGDLRRLGGKMLLTAKRLKVGDLALTDLTLEAALEEGALRILSLTGTGPGCHGEMAGHLTLNSDRLGGLELKGSAGVGSEGALRGKIWLKGKSLGHMALSGALKGGHRIPRASGKDKAAPMLKLNVKLGSRRLTGTLRSWRIR